LFVLVELRHAEWSEFDFEEKVWRIPAEKMKMHLPHIVPLSDQVISWLNPGLTSWI
jgi:integrase